MAIVIQKKDSRSGQAMLIIVLLASVFLSLAAMSTDFVFAYVVKSRLVTAIDAAALGAVRNIGQGSAQMEKTIELLFKANFPDDFMLTTGSAYSPPVVNDSLAGGPSNRDLSGSEPADVLYENSRLRQPYLESFGRCRAP